MAARSRKGGMMNIPDDILIRNMSHPVIILDSRDRVSNINSSALRILKLSRKDVLGSDFIGNPGISIDDENFMKSFREFSKKRKTLTTQLTLSAGGRDFFFKCCFNPIFVSRAYQGVLIEWNNVTEEKNLLWENERKLRRISAVQDVSSTLAATLDIEKVLNLIIIKIVKLFRVDVCSILLLDESQKNLKVESVYNLGEEYIQKDPVLLQGSLTGKAIMTRGIQESPDVQNDNRFQHRAIAKKAGLTSFLSVPLVSKTAPLGALNIYTKRSRRFNDDEKSLLTILASQAAVAIENAKLYSTVKRDTERLKSLLEISHAMSSTLRLDKVLNIILDRALRLLGGRRTAILLRKGSYLMTVASDGYDTSVMSRIRLRIGEGITGWVAKKGLPLVINDVDKDKRYIRASPDTKSEAAVPLFVHNKLIGVLNVESDRLNEFEGKLSELQVLGNSVAMSIENARLYHKVDNFNKTLQEEIFQATKELEAKTKELEEKNKKLMELDRLKSDFVSIVSHELKTPLTSIKGYASLMLQGRIKNNAVQRKCLSIINTESDKLAALINDILDLSKLESGKMSLNREKIDMAKVIHSVNNRMIHQALKKNIVIKKDLPPALPKVYADKHKADQMLTNLVSNAIKFTDEGGTVKISVKPTSKFLVTSVSDTGIGIEGSEIPKLFQRFYQVDSKLTRSQGGTGLGLAIFKELVGLHNGFIAVKSKVGVGTMISFALPLRKTDKMPEEKICWEHIDCSHDDCPFVKGNDSMGWHVFCPPEI
ncbi:GAF domain-containing protein [Candidatus Woesearchaeota archaeon]|nr:GAF domain-containing protein [Candidatus Woesearchaeota archaeon]